MPVNTSFNAWYGASKMVGGVLADLLPPAPLYIVSLVGSGGACLVFGSVTSLNALIAAWGIHGVAQGKCARTQQEFVLVLRLAAALLHGTGFCWPSLAKMLVQYVPERARGRYWGIISTASNIGQVSTACAPSPPVLSH